MLGWPLAVAALIGWPTIYLDQASGNLGGNVIWYALNSIALGWMLVAAQSVLAGKPANDALGFRRAMEKWFALAVIGLFEGVPWMFFPTHPTAFGPGQHGRSLSVVLLVWLLEIIVGFLLIYANAFVVLGNQSLISAIWSSFSLSVSNSTSTLTLLLANGVVGFIFAIPYLLLLRLAPAAHFAVVPVIALSLLPAGTFRALSKLKFYNGLVALETKPLNATV